MILKYICFFVNLLELVSRAWQTICLDFVIQKVLLMSCLLREIIWYNNFPLQKNPCLWKFLGGGGSLHPPAPKPLDSTALLALFCLCLIDNFTMTNFLHYPKTFKRAKLMTFPRGQIKKVMNFALYFDIHWYGLALLLQAVRWIELL